MAFLRGFQLLMPRHLGMAAGSPVVHSKRVRYVALTFCALFVAATIRLSSRHLAHLDLMDPFTRQLSSSLAYVIALSPAIFAARYVLQAPLLKRMVVVAFICAILESGLELTENTAIANTLPVLSHDSYVKFTIQSLLDYASFLLLASVAYLALITRSESVKWAATATEQLQTEVSTRQRIQTELALSEARHRLLMENAQGLAVIGYGLDGVIQYWNRPCEQMYGYRADEAIGRSLSDLILGDEDLPVHQKCIARAKTVSESETLTTPHERELRNKDGGKVPVYVVDAVVCVDGHTPVLFSIQFDLRERKRAEKALEASEDRFRSIIHNAMDIIVIVSASGVIQYISPSVKRVLGYDEQRLIGNNLFEVVHPEDQPIALKKMAAGARDEWENRITECRVRHIDGSWRYMEVSGTNMLERNSIKGLVLNARDVTDRKLLETQYRQSQKMEALGTLAGGVAHDFNNLLTAILMNCELLQAAPNLEPAVQSGVEEIYKAGRRATGLTRQLLTFSKRSPCKPQIVDLNALIREMEKMLCRLIGEDVRLATQLPDAPLLCFADVSQIEQIILNLVVNARDAMPDGGQLRITLSETKVEQGTRESGALDIAVGDYIKISVADTGCGIEADSRSRIFEPFFTTKPEGRGTGLGLATVYGIVRQCSGNIEVHSEVGKGTTFEILLPQMHPASLEESPAIQHVSQWPLTQATVLVVEDETDILDLSARILREHGYVVLKAGSPGEALRICEQYDGKIDLVLSDVIMPDLTGPGMVKRIRAIRPGIQVLYMSGYTADRIESSGVAVDSTRLLEKPFTLEQLVSSVERALGATSAGSAKGQWVVFD